MKTFSNIAADAGYQLMESAQSKKLFDLNKDRKPGQHKVNTSNEKENIKTVILSASPKHLTHVLKSGTDITIYHTDASGETIIDLDASEAKVLKSFI
ncbi:hypothetical protein ACX818_001491, partial [Acinetobacter baumannii]